MTPSSGATDVNPNDGTSERRLARAIIAVALLGAVIGGVGAPLITSAALDLNVPLEAAQLTLTITLFTGAVFAPVLGRLGAGPRRRTTILIALALVALGGLLTALPAPFAVLIVGRGLQGLGLGVTPLLMSIARDRLSAARAESTIATVSVASTVGIGIAYPLMGFLNEVAGLRIAYGLGFGLSLTALVIAWLSLPHNDSRRRVRIDIPGALLLAMGILGVLMVVAQPSVWVRPWVGFLILAVAAAAIAAWAAVERRSPSPLVDLRLFFARNVLRTNIAMLASAVAMYLLFSLFTRYVQTPINSGYGFGLTGAGAGAALIPFSVLGLLAGRATPPLAAKTSARRTFAIHSASLVASMALFALTTDSLIAALAAMSLLGFGVGGVSAIMPRLILEGVPKTETSSILSINQIVRASGFSLGSALAGLLLATATRSGSLLPEASGYTTAGLWALPLIALGVAVIVIPPRQPR